MRLEILLPQPLDLGQPCGVGTPLRCARSGLELRLQQRPQRAEAVQPAGKIRPDAVVGVTPLALLADEPRLLEEPQVPGHARLRNPEDPGQLAHIQTLHCQQSEQAEPRLIPKQPVDSGRIHIHECI